MKADSKRKVFLGIGRFMLPLPLALIKKAINGTADNICRLTADISEDERRVHRFVVMAVTETNEPVTSKHIAAKLEMSLDRVKQIVNKLEEMKVFFYRYNSEGINWAYPVTTENVAHKMTFSTGEQCRAAGAPDAVANPFVQGRLRNENLSMMIDSECANSGKPIKIELDSALNIKYVAEGSTPIICQPLVNFIETKDPSIVDIFGRKSLFFWSEEEAREYQKKTRGGPTLYLNLPLNADANKIVQAANFPIDDGSGGSWQVFLNISNGQGDPASEFTNEKGSRVKTCQGFRGEQ